MTTYAEICLKSEGDTLVIGFTGSKILDDKQIATIGRELLSACRDATHDASRIVLDFNNIRFCSSALIGKIVLLNKAAKGHGIQLPCLLCSWSSVQLPSALSAPRSTCVKHRPTDRPTDSYHRGFNMKEILAAVFVVPLVCSTAFSGSQLSQQKGGTDDRYHLLAIGKLGEDDLLKHPGFIIGIEKIKRKLLGNAPEQGDPRRYRVAPNTNSKEQNEFEERTDDRNVMVVTHAFSFLASDDDQTTKLEKTEIYNAYNPRDEKPPNFSYESGYLCLDAIDRRLGKALTQASEENRPYSHLLFLAMGWNNDQKESIRRYNEILSNLEDAAELAGERQYRPLAVGISWPSVWKTGLNSKVDKLLHFTSYVNKANDADEIGFTLANTILNRILLRHKAECAERGETVQVVTIGHSLGARLLSRALFSNSYLKDDTARANLEVDLSLGLQGAFSANRFVEDEGNEGAPYRRYRDRRTAIVVTTSVHDDANPVARLVTGAKHIGGKYGLATASKRSDVFDLTRWKKQGGLRADSARPGSARKVICIDAQDIVNEHNDVLDREMGELLWNMMEHFAPARIEQ